MEITELIDWFARKIEGQTQDGKVHSKVTNKGEDGLLFSLDGRFYVLSLELLSESLQVPG